jgi:CRISPR system Cascade subunit CasD
VKSVLLRLAGPLQSWGTQGRFGVRDTDREPSKSGVLGLVGAALGMPRDDDAMLARLRALRLAIRVDREGTPLRDYHTVGGGQFRGQPLGLWSVEEQKRKPDLTALTTRYYLCDASFLCALGGADHELVDHIGRALQHAVWPLFLGRRSCPPAESVFAGIVSEAPELAVVHAALAEPDRKRAEPQLRVVLEATSTDGRPRQDDPQSFTSTARRHGLRHVRFEFVDRDSLPEKSP